MRNGLRIGVCEMRVTSSAFQHGQDMPVRYTGDGADVSPPLSWADPPEGTWGFVVLSHDPDAPVCTPGTYGFSHWALYNLPPSVMSLDEGTSLGTVGINDYGHAGYGGPAPPKGHGKHYYYFLVFALTRRLDLEPGLTMWQVLENIEPYVLGIDRIAGVYQRP